MNDEWSATGRGGTGRGLGAGGGGEWAGGPMLRPFGGLRYHCVEKQDKSRILHYDRLVYVENSRGLRPVSPSDIGRRSIRDELEVSLGGWTENIFGPHHALAI